MIAATVEELTPIIGTRPACRALGACPATVARRQAWWRPGATQPADPSCLRQARAVGRAAQRVVVVTSRS
jgi:hypothetical protein